MSKFTFICEDENIPFSGDITTKRTFEFNGENLDDIVHEFETFLKGCGFNFNGKLDFVEENSVNDITQLSRTMASISGIKPVEDDYNSMSPAGSNWKIQL